MMRERSWIVLIGAIQGLLLLAAHEALARGLWPATSMPVVIAWYAGVIGVPVAAELLWHEGTRRRRAGFVLGLGLVLAGLGAYAGYAVGGGGEARAGSWFAFGFTVAVAWFVALPFAATWIRRGRPEFPYQELFASAWGNTLTLAFAAMFTGVFWALLALWAGLFGVIGIEFFADVFTRREFIYPATTIAFSFAVSLGHTHATAVATIRKVTLSTYRGLLPLLALIALLFLLFLPVTGLQPLWDTGRAATLMLVTQFAMILFINAAYQDGNVEAPYHPWVRRVVMLSMVALPVYSGLTLYALLLRVSQHGWTGARVWGALLAVIAALYAVGYMAAALARRARWLAWVAPVNVAMALATVGLLVLANTPLLDPMRIGAESQLNRLLTGQVQTEEFDYRYLRFEAGRYGLQALERLAETSGDGDAEAIRTAAKAALAQTHRWAKPPASAAQFLAHVNTFPEGRVPDPAFLQFLAQEDGDSASCAAPHQDCMLLAVDLNQDGTDEYVEFFYPFHLYARGQKGWRKAGRVEAQGGWDLAELRAALVRRDFSAVQPAWPDLQVGDVRYGIIVERGGVE